MAPIVTTSGRKRGRSFQETPRLRLLVALAVAAIVAGVAVCLLRKGQSLSEPPQQASATVPVEPAATPSAATDAAVRPAEPSATRPSAPPPASPDVPTVVAPPLIPRPQPGAIFPVAMPGGRMVRMRLPEDGATNIVHMQGSTYSIDSEGNVTDITPKAVFDNVFENQLLGMALEKGTFISGFVTQYTREQVVEMLQKPVEILEDDTDDVKAKKEAVADLKAAALQYLDEGGTWGQFVAEMQSYASQERSLKAKGMRKVLELARDGKVDEARAFLEEYNGILKEQGYSELKLPARFAEKIK